MKISLQFLSGRTNHIGKRVQWFCWVQCNTMILLFMLTITSAFVKCCRELERLHREMFAFCELERLHHEMLVFCELLFSLYKNSLFLNTHMLSLKFKDNVYVKQKIFWKFDLFTQMRCQHGFEKVGFLQRIDFYIKNFFNSYREE